MKNNKLVFKKIAVKLCKKAPKTVGIMGYGKEDHAKKLAKSAAKLKKTAFLNFTKMENYGLKDYSSMVIKNENLGIVNISFDNDIGNLINSLEFKDFYEKLKRDYDLILVNETEDDSLSYLMAGYDDEKLYLVKEEKTKRNEFEKLKDEFSKLSCPIKGVVYYI